MRWQRRPWAACRWLAGLALAAVPWPADAQQAPVPVACTGQMVSEIRVLTRPPYDRSTGRWWEAPLRVANSLHMTTRPDVVRRFLVVREGEPCRERERRESERILRAQPYIATASVRAYDDSAGGVRLVVITVDELTPVVDVRATGAQPYVRRLVLGDGNISGLGIYAAGGWEQGVVRDGWEARVVDYQLLGRPYILDVAGARRAAGFGTWTVDLRHPYYTDLQRFAWRASAGNRNDVLGLLRGDTTAIPIAVSRRYANVGGVMRVGTTGRLSLFGLSFTTEVDRTALPPQPDTLADYNWLLSQYQPRRSARVNALWGVRNIYFRTVERFDALSGTQDLPLGFQLGTLLGRSIPALGPTDDDIFVASDLYAGLGNERSAAVLRLRGQGREDSRSTRWDGIFLSGSLRVYRRLRPNQTGLLTVAWAGGWRSRVPFQLSLGDQVAGVRGYGGSQLAGGRRAVVRLEDRWYMGVVRERADVGLSFFTDIGKVWAGDIPLGQSSPLRMGAGFGVVAGLPPGSRRNWRLDFAFPLQPDGRRRWEVRFGTVLVNPLREREPRDVRWSSEQAVPASAFDWP